MVGVATFESTTSSSSCNNLSPRWKPYELGLIYSSLYGSMTICSTFRISLISEPVSITIVNLDFSIGRRNRKDIVFATNPRQMGLERKICDRTHQKLAIFTYLLAAPHFNR